MPSAHPVQICPFNAIIEFSHPPIHNFVGPPLDWWNFASTSDAEVGRHPPRIGVLWLNSKSNRKAGGDIVEKIHASIVGPFLLSNSASLRDAIPNGKEIYKNRLTKIIQVKTLDFRYPKIKTLDFFISKIEFFGGCYNKSTHRFALHSARGAKLACVEPLHWNEF